MQFGSQLFFKPQTYSITFIEEGNEVSMISLTIVHANAAAAGHVGGVVIKGNVPLPAAGSAFEQ